MAIHKPRRRKMSDLSNPDFVPETRKAWKRSKRSDLPKGKSIRHLTRKERRALEREKAEKAAK
jgi:hypothetical protein